MEDDDEFGDLYTDVLRPFTTTPSQQQESPPAPSAAAAKSGTTLFPSRRPMDLNNIDSDDEEIIFGASDSHSNAKINNNINNNINGISLMHKKTLALQPELDKLLDPKISDSDRVSNLVVGCIEGLNGRGGELGSRAIVLDNSDDRMSETKEKARGLFNFMDEEGDIEVIVEERDDKDDEFVVKDENLVGKSENFENIGGEERLPMIPGVSSIAPVSRAVGEQDRGDVCFGEEDDSDSEDGLQIVLNNDSELAAMENIGGMGHDEDLDPLVIVADNDNLGNQPMLGDQEWRDDPSKAEDGERKELGDAVKANGGVALPPKVPYSSHSYHHPFHSQFKYVRPDASPMPGAAPAEPGGAPGQVRPLVNVGPVIGRGRGDWRPPGVKGGPFGQKGFHPGYGVPVWGSNTAGRGLDFTLPSHKTIFEVDIDSFEDKPWRLPGIDISDFFNFSLNEESWKGYCKQLEQHRLETTMQGKIRVYESGRTEQEYDPDLPPELVAASGVQGIPSENANLVKTNISQVPTGRPIQVETNYTDRLPSIDTRQPRIRDSDAIIEIVCLNSADEDSPENDTVEQQDNEIPRQDLKGGDQLDDFSKEIAKHFDDCSHASNSGTKEYEGRRGHVINPLRDKIIDGAEALPLSSESSMRCHPGAREQTPQYSGRDSGVASEERRMKARRCERSPRKASNGSIRDKLIDDQTEESKSIDGRNTPLPLSPVSVGAAGEQDVENELIVPDESVQADADTTSEIESEGLELDIGQDDMLEDENLTHSEKQKSSLLVEQASLGIDDGEDLKDARSSENSMPRPRSSGYYRKSRDGVEEEVVESGRPAYMSNVKRSVDRADDMIHRRSHDKRQGTERRHISVKGRGESYSRKGWDPNQLDHLRGRSDMADQQRESNNAERVLHRSDGYVHGRRYDHANENHEIGSRHLNKARGNERSEIGEYHQLREHVDNGSRRVNLVKDMGLKHGNRDNSLKRREENIDNLRNTWGKEKTFPMREQAGKEEISHGNRESSSRQKRERDDISDEPKRDVHARLRDDDIYSVRQKEELLSQRERGDGPRDRDQTYRLNHSNEGIFSKREREETLSGLKNIRGPEENVRLSHSRGKDDYRDSYHSKDSGRHSEQPRRDRIERENIAQHKGRDDVYVRGNQHNGDGRKVRHERESSRDDRAANDSYNLKVHIKELKEYPKKGKEFERGDSRSLPLPKRGRDVYGGQKSDMASLKGKIGQRRSENEACVNHQSSMKEEVSSDDEQSRIRRGRSKLERWMSPKERDFKMNSKLSSSLPVEADKHNYSGPSLGSKLPDEPSKPAEDEQHPPAKDKEVMEINDADVKLVDNKHLDTVEKLKKRSERFKLPMPIEKEATASKKIENELPPPTQNEIRSDTEIKPERPARKRRWTNIS